MSRPDEPGLFTDDELAWEDEPGAAARDDGDPAVAPRGATREAPAAPPYRRRRLVLVGAAAVVAVAGVALGLALTGGDGSQTAPTQATTPRTTPPPTSAPTTTTAPAPTFALPGGQPLKPGDTGAAVRSLQQALTTLGFDVGKVDGVYGDTTTAAVKQFQQQQGLTADGVVGADTAAAISSALAG